MGNLMKTKNALCGLSIAVVLHFGALAASAQTYTYTYTGSDFTSIFNAPPMGFLNGGLIHPQTRLQGP